MPFFKRSKQQAKKHKQAQAQETPPLVEVKEADPILSVVQSSESDEVELCLGTDTAAEYQHPTSDTSSHMTIQQQAAAGVHTVSCSSSNAHEHGDATWNITKHSRVDASSTTVGEQEEDVEDERMSSDYSDDDADDSSSSSFCTTDGNDTMTLSTMQTLPYVPKQASSNKQKSTAALSWNTLNLLGCNGAGCLNDGNNVNTTSVNVVTKNHHYNYYSANNNYNKQHQEELAQDLNCSYTQSFSTSYEDDDHDHDHGDDDDVDTYEAEYVHEDVAAVIVGAGEEENGSIAASIASSEVTGPVQANHRHHRSQSFRKDSQIDWMKRNMNGLLELAKNMPGA